MVLKFLHLIIAPLFYQPKYILTPTEHSMPIGFLLYLLTTLDFILNL